MASNDIPQEPAANITPPELYFNRRQLMRGGVLAGSLLATGSLYRWLNPIRRPGKVLPQLDVPLAAAGAEGPSDVDPVESGFTVDEALTPELDITTFNNFYEFSTDKDAVAYLASDFKTAGWKITIDGLVDHPTVMTLDDLRAISPLEERVYRMRCVEAWSMVIPWAGIPLSRVLEKVSPKSTARYVAFETLLDPTQMPGQRTGVLDWPYVEGLRLDEAMHPLTILAMGLYGKELPPQDGAPVRLVVPWKYGFKGIKSIVRITLTDKQPPCTWNLAGPHEYGFYANVNPQVDHPRWSQATEQRIGEFTRRKTLMFNGYEEQVASLYEGLDLTRNF